MFAQDHGLNLCGRHFQALGQVAAKARCIQLGSQSDDALPGKTGTLHGEMGEHINRIAHDDQIRILLQAGRLYLVEQTKEQIDVAIDQIEPALLGLAAQAGRNDDDVAGRDIAHVAGSDALVRNQTSTMKKVGGHALGHAFISVDYADTTDHAAALKGIGRHAADQAAATDNGDFHGDPFRARRRLAAKGAIIYALANAAITCSVTSLTSVSTSGVCAEWPLLLGETTAFSSM